MTVLNLKTLPRPSFKAREENETPVGGARFPVWKREEEEDTHLLSNPKYFSLLAHGGGRTRAVKLVDIIVPVSSRSALPFSSRRTASPLLLLLLLLPLRAEKNTKTYLRCVEIFSFSSRCGQREEARRHTDWQQPRGTPREKKIRGQEKTSRTCTRKRYELNGDIRVTRFAPLSRVAFREVLPSNLEIYTLSIVKKHIPEQAHTARGNINKKMSTATGSSSSSLTFASRRAMAASRGVSSSGRHASSLAMRASPSSRSSNSISTTTRGGNFFVTARRAATSTAAKAASTTEETTVSSTTTSTSKDLLKDLPKEIGSCSKEELDQWLTEAMRLPKQKMKLEYFKEEGRGLVATEPIKRGEKVLEIPRDAIITVEVALKESLLEKKKLSELQEWSILATFLAETAQSLSQENSSKYRFATYVKALPRSTGSVLEWPESDVRTLLAGSPSLFSALERRASVAAAITEIRANFPELNEKTLQWAFDILFSRLIRLESLGGNLALVPWADMLNHQPGCEAFIDLDRGSSKVCLTTDRSYEPGEQVWASYGQRPSSELLISYGFAPAVGDNPDDEYALNLQIDEEDPFASAKVNALASQNIQAFETFPLRLNGYPRQLLQYASFAMCTPDDPSKVDELCRAAFVDIQAPKSLRNGVDLARGLLASKNVFKSKGKRGAVLGGVQGEIAVREMLADVTRDALDRYPNTVEKDKGLALGRMPEMPEASMWIGDASTAIKSSMRSVCAARVRVSERRILAKTDSEVRLQLRRLKSEQMNSK